MVFLGQNFLSGHINIIHSTVKSNSPKKLKKPLRAKNVR